VILHKDDTHKSTEIPLQFHSIVDNQSMDVKALLWLKRTAAALHVFSSHKGFLVNALENARV
jgi:hypothetical protein